MANGNFGDGYICLGENVSNTADEPDADSIKLFVGQIPREISEEELRKIFEVYGPIHQLSKVKDRNTQEYKGCAFLTYYKRQSAIDAQNELHGKKSFPGLKGLMQVKPANSELKNEEERKLFVGMLPKNMADAELLNEMLPFGAVEDCVILRDRDGNSKGCAFVTYATKKSAGNAIKGLHHAKTLEGATAPLVVKVAETQREKEMKKGVKDGTMYNPASLNFAATASQIPVTPNYFGPAVMNNQLAQQVQPNPTMNALSTLTQTPGLVNPNLQNLGSALAAIASDPVLSAFLNPNVPLIQQLTSGAANAVNQLPPNTNFGVYGNNQAANPSAPVVNWKNPGMDDCNLFIFNIPENYREPDLIQLFAPFGNIVSSRVYYDKKTNKSKGFGFVSYDNPSSSKAAIQAMNGAHVGNRRIKVELKKPRPDGKPY